MLALATALDKVFFRGYVLTLAAALDQVFPQVIRVYVSYSVSYSTLDQM